MSSFPPADIDSDDYDDPRMRVFDCTDNYKDEKFVERRPQPMANFVEVIKDEQEKKEEKKEEVASGMKTEPIDLHGQKMPAPQ